MESAATTPQKDDGQQEAKDASSAANDELLSKKNPHERDDGILFDAETHTYTIAQDNNSPEAVVSVTELIGSFFNPFEADRVIQKNYDKWQRPSSSSPCKGKSPRQIKEQWDNERDLGTELHEHIETWFDQEEPDVVVDEAKHPEWERFLEFEKEYARGKIVPFRTEWRIWSGEHRLAGTIDLVSENVVAKGSSKTYSLYDWKRTKHPIEQNAYCFGKYGKGPLAGVPDTKYNIYRLQLSL